METVPQRGATRLKTRFLVLMLIIFGYRFEGTVYSLLPAFEIESCLSLNSDRL